MGRLIFFLKNISDSHSNIILTKSQPVAGFNREFVQVNESHTTVENFNKFICLRIKIFDLMKDDKVINYSIKTV